TRFSRDWSSDVCSSDLSRGVGFEHHVQPGVMSISQSTEYGTVYTVEELVTLVDTAHRHGLLVHVDGARLANAAAAIGASLGDIRSEERRVGNKGRFRW